jgi:hypothetical protein
MDSKLQVLINLEFSSYGRKQMLSKYVQSMNYHMTIIVVVFATHLLHVCTKVCLLCNMLHTTKFRNRSS